MLKFFQRFHRSLRFRMMVAVNASLIVVMGGFLGVDYSLEYREHVREQIAGLAAEARVLIAASHHLQGQKEFQQYLEEYCRQMKMPASPGHHIIVVGPDDGIQMRAHQRGTPEMEEAMLRALRREDHTASAGDYDVVAGEAKGGNRRMIVGERMDNIERLVRSQLIRRVTSILIACGAIVLLVNLLLNRFVVRPIASLVSGVRAIREGSLGHRLESQSAEEFQFLAEEFNAMSSALQKAETRRKNQMLRAAQIQTKLLPESSAVHDALDVHVLFRPAEEVGGDFYDFFRLPDGRWIVTIADVSGHGVPAAMISAMLKLLLHTHATRDATASGIVEQLDSSLGKLLLEEDFVTLVLLLIDENSQRLSYINAGHESCLLLGADESRLHLLAGANPSLGLNVFEQLEWKEETISYRPGDVIVIWTDGISEAINEEGEFYGRHRLIDLLKGQAGRTPEELIKTVRSAMDDFTTGVPPHDDMTLLAVGTARANKNGVA